MTDEEMLQDTIERIKQADRADLSAIHEYLVWSQGRYTLWATTKAQQDDIEKQQLEKVKKFEQFLT